MTTQITIPEVCLILLVGPSGAGKTSFATRHFAPTEILSSDSYRAIVSDNPNDDAATKDAFDLIKQVVKYRLVRKKLTVIDATNLRAENRLEMVELAQNCFANAISFVFDVDEQTCLERNALKENSFPKKVIARHIILAKNALHYGRREGFSKVHLLPADALNSVEIVREKLRCDLRHEHGPFDIIGDVHGCFYELFDLVHKLGYRVNITQGRASTDWKRHVTFGVSHPEGRRLLAVGDFCDRGPDAAKVLSFFMDVVASGGGFCVRGNHDLKLLRWLRGKKVSDRHGFDITSADLSHPDDEGFRTEIKNFLSNLPTHYVLDDGQLAVAHAGVKEEMLGGAGGVVNNFCMFGEITGETDSFGLPVRLEWADHYKGKTSIVYGHVPWEEAEWHNNTMCIDTGCCFGGKLTALRWPERELVQIPAQKVYFEPIRPLNKRGSKASNQLPDVSEISRGFTVKIGKDDGFELKIHPDLAAASFEALVRHSADPRWLTFIPPTTATVESSSLVDYLEHPMEAFEHYKSVGLTHVCVQEKHMGSRAVVIACRDNGERFGDPDRLGAVLTKYGRNFFDDPVEEAFIVNGVREAMSLSGLWGVLQTDWIILDGEMLPWNAKAKGLIRNTFAATGAAARESSLMTANAFHEAFTRLNGMEAAQPINDLSENLMNLYHKAGWYQKAYRNYVMPYHGHEDLRFAPFHVLATEGTVHTHESHSWHLGVAEMLAAQSNIIIPTTSQNVDLSSEQQISAAIEWWKAITENGHEGFVVKGDRLGLSQNRRMSPSIKVRGKEYLRIIYGIDYDSPEILKQLKVRSTGKKRSMARSGLALGLEGLQRFVDRRPLAEVHQVIAASLAIASDPIDSRL